MCLEEYAEPAAGFVHVRQPERSNGARTVVAAAAEAAAADARVAVGANHDDVALMSASNRRAERVVVGEPLRLVSGRHRSVSRDEEDSDLRSTVARLSSE
eukprot:7386269-Prymnesium_polylepis.2